MQYASRPSRLMGQVMDGLVAIAPVVGLVIIPKSNEMASAVYAIAWLCWMFFHILLADGLEGGQSLGKRIVKTRVVDAETGAPCTFWQSLIRNLLLSLLGPLDWLFIFGAKHQRLGDKAAGTIVITA
jgi:uncharacterized RDD family membrane protein YckC